jgi:broad specificity phosphatase PhoE
MPEIFLMRHGKPAFDDRTPIAGSAFAAWVRGYDRAPLDMSVPPSPGLRAQAAAVGCVATSTLRRAQESAALLAAGRRVVSDSLFAEAGLPSAIPSSLRLAPRHWVFLARVAWFCGWSRDTESLREARSRAHRAAERLAELAHTHGSVMLVGHGLMSALILRVLGKAGWRGSASRATYWSVVAMERAA